MPPTNANALTPSTTTTTTTNNSNAPSGGVAAVMGSPKKDSTSSPPQQQQQQLRPPLYNAEDYASALRALFTNSLSLPNNNSSNHHHHYQHAPPPTSLILEHASTHPPLIPGQGLVDMNKHNHHHNGGSSSNKTPTAPEMSMKKFINGSELLFKLEADLRSAFPSFVQEFVSGDSEGVSCILDALRTVHEALDHVNGLREQRKLVLDERSCIQCLHLMMRNIDAIQKLLTYPHGLYPIVHCTVSTNTSTRVLALEILTSICEQGGSSGVSGNSINNDAFAKVSEAISTLRLRLGEPIRCKVLVGAITSAAAGVFQATGIRFLKSYVGAAPSAKFKVYLQVELEEAGFHVDVIRKSAELSPARESRLVIQEIDEWDRVVVDVDTVVRQNSQLRNSVATLQQEIATLKDRIKKQEPSQSTSTHQSSSIPVYATPRQSHPKFTKKKQHSNSNNNNNNNTQSQQQQQQQSHQNRQLHSSTPIQTITTPVDSEEEAEQIHQILEDLHNIVNNEMLQGNGNMISNNNENNNRNSSNNIASSAMSTTTCSTTSGEIVPVLNSSRPPLMLMNHNNRNTRPVHSEPNLLFMDESSSSATFYQNNSDDQAGGGSGGRVKDVVQQLENSNVLFNTLPNFNTGGLASKFANFKSTKLDGGSGGRSGNNNSGWGDTTGSSDSNNLMMMMTMMEQAQMQAQMQGGGVGGSGSRTRVKSLENLDNFTLKWKYPVVVGGGGEGSGSGGGKPHALQLQQQQQPNSLVVLQDYRMNRFGSGGGGGGGAGNSSSNNKSSKEQRNSPSKESSGSSSGGGGPAAVVAGLFSKNKKKHLVQHPQKTFQISLVGGNGGSKQQGGPETSGGGGSSKVTNSNNNNNMNFNDLGGGGGGGSGGSNNPSSLLLLERVTDLPSGLY